MIASGACCGRVRGPGGVQPQGGARIRPRGDTHWEGGNSPACIVWARVVMRAGGRPGGIANGTGFRFAPRVPTRYAGSGGARTNVPGLAWCSGRSWANGCRSHWGNTTPRSRREPGIPPETEQGKADRKAPWPVHAPDRSRTMTISGRAGVNHRPVPPWRRAGEYRPVQTGNRRTGGRDMRNERQASVTRTGSISPGPYHAAPTRGTGRVP